jgi:hypothetical protein
MLKRIPEWVDDREDVESLLARGYGPDDRPPGKVRGTIATAGEIAPLHDAAGVETIILTAESREFQPTTKAITV